MDARAVVDVLSFIIRLWHMNSVSLSMSAPLHTSPLAGLQHSTTLRQIDEPI